ncbi:hypothetical protein CIB84_005017 [Bambusicola thoracicus]|uniref:Ectonucleoside triphosphate diphosphohydrolase 8 n=1 Tax=Bambusicola thoracicus TaxID=9083 RepID=A0A2P4T4D0_BAMTH|nr:hypothetical protein CIB84_005017 [Bambusicola thoracicus]
MMFVNKKLFTTALLGLLVTLSIIALVLSLVRVEDVTLPPTVQYGMVFDAGSSHTSLFVYEWDSDKQNNTGVVSQTLSCDVQGQYSLGKGLCGPGISSYADDPPKAGDSLRECLDEALKVIPAAKQRDVSAYFGATAGMRLLRFMLYGYNYNIYTHSYICYGQNEMWKRLAKELIVESSSSTLVEHPCYPKDYKETISLSSFRTSPCTNQSDPRLPLDDRNVTLEGRSNASGCLVAVKKLFNFSACGQSQDCSFDGIYQPPVSGQFFAFSAFYYNFKFLNLTEGQSLATVRETIEHFCARTWEDVQNLERLPKYCANANYILTLLLDAYKFNETSWNNIFFQMKVGSTNVGWTLGYMLNLTNMIPAEAPLWVKGHTPSLWAAAIAFVTLTMALGLIALVVLLWT